MEVHLTADQKAFVRQAIKTGRLNREEDAVKEALSMCVLAIIEKRAFLNGVPTGIAEGWPEMDRSRGCLDR
jgi:hypothetical protein